VGVTLGPGGALAYVHGRFHYVPAFHVPVVDSTGAGDIFHAGAIYGLLHSWPVAETLRFAATAAALKCEKLGGRPGIPTLERALALARTERGGCDA
jgi:sugar/nucleoside kinase (ribokinase family)